MSECSHPVGSIAIALPTIGRTVVGDRFGVCLDCGAWLASEVIGLPWRRLLVGDAWRAGAGLMVVRDATRRAARCETCAKPIVGGAYIIRSTIEVVFMRSMTPLEGIKVLPIQRYRSTTSCLSCVFAKLSFSVEEE